MIIGQSIFDAVMARLKEEWEEQNDTPYPSEPSDSGWTGIRGLKTSFIQSSPGTDDIDHDRSLHSVYFAFPAEDMPPNSQDPGTTSQEFDPRPFNRLSLEEIASDLGITGNDTAAKLLERRREFARINHPDRVPTEWREKANLRMKIANLLVDEAIHSKKKVG